MIRFLFGRPGSGKTYRMVEEIRAHVADGSHPVYLIVPEQQVYSAERDILSALPPDAGRCFSIISFSRLCDTLADRFGGRTQHSVTRAMRSLIMWQNLRELTGILETYGGYAATDTALCGKMLRAAEELKLNGIRPDELERAANRLEEQAPLRVKLRDLALVSAAYDGLMTDIYGENPADRLLRAAAQIEEHDFFTGAEVYVDSFVSFTMQEYAVLRPLMEQAANVTISFACRGRNERDPQFDSMRDALQRLTRLCTDAGLDYEDICLTDVRRTAAPELLALERELWAFGLTPDEMEIIPEAERGHIRTVVCPTIYDEAQAAALHILELHKAGVPYGEIALVVRDTATQNGVLDAALDQYHIPYFLSARTDLSEKPAARLLLTALRCIARRWQTEDIMALGKTGLVGVTPRELDYFQEYVETWHLGGRRMTEPAWSMNPDGYTTEMSPRGKEILIAANRVREVIMTPLLSLETDLRGATDVTGECRALFAYLTALGVKEQLTANAETYLAMGQVREAGEQVRLWSFLTETLASVAGVMQETADVLSPAELGTALSLVFAETDIGSVPARHDCVTVGSASMLRVDNIRAMLVLGLCEGEFPQTVKEDGLLTEQDKATLETLGIELDTRTERLTSDELFYAYRTLTKPSETLILSYSTSTPDGQTRSPSAVMTRVKYLFPYIHATPFASSMVELDSNGDRYRTPAEDSISRPTARRLLGDEIWLSQSRLQTYARCPYSYYGSHILRLREKTEAQFDNLGAGVFLHHVMEQYLRAALDEHNRIRPMEPAEVTAVADAVMDAYIKELCGDISENGRLLRLFDRLRQVALVLIDSIQAELRQSSFSVAGLEWDTHGRHAGDPFPMVLPLSTPYTLDPEFGGLPIPVRDKPRATLFPPTVDNSITAVEENPAETVKLLLGGRIDRVDLYRAADGETVYVRVIDYKSSRHEFTTKSIVGDMNVQLLLYLFTLCSPENRALFADEQGRVPARVLPASAVYISPDESARDGTILPCRTGVVLGEPEILEAANSDPEAVYLPSVRRGKAGELTGKGLCSPEQMADLEDILKTAIRDTAATMYSGQAGRTPSAEACRYCRMKGSCALCQS